RFLVLNEMNDEPYFHAVPFYVQNGEISDFSNGSVKIIDTACKAEGIEKIVKEISRILSKHKENLLERNKLLTQKEKSKAQIQRLDEMNRQSYYMLEKPIDPLSALDNDLRATGEYHENILTVEEIEK